MREEIQSVIDGHMSISELVDKIAQGSECSLEKTKIMNELWKELDKINGVFAKEVEKRESKAS